VYWAFRIASALAQTVPVRLSYAVASLAGLLVYYAWTGGRRRCISNMSHVAAGDMRRARSLARRSFVNYAGYLVDFLRFTSVSAAEVRQRLVFDGWDRLEAERAGNGILFVTVHYGNWDLGAAAVAARGIPIAVIADTFGDPRLNELVLGARRHLGMQIIPAERMGPSVLRALRRNDVVAMLVDIPQPEGGVEVEFFGAPIAVAGGPARIALRTGATIVPVMLPRVGRTEAVRGYIDPVRFTPSGEQERDVQALTQAMMTALEGMMRADPEQWYIFRNLWVADRKGGH
jgi:lauroyl/myristoyl acyltransferase